MQNKLGRYARDAKQRIRRKVPSFRPGELENAPESILITGAALAAGVLVRRSLVSVWKAWRGSEPPDNPADPEVTWSDALIWAAAVGTSVGVARVLGRRGSTGLARKYALSKT